MYIVTNLSELIAALNNGVVSSTSHPSNEPKIIYVKGVIDANVDDASQPLSCSDYYRNGHTPEAFLATWLPGPQWLSNFGTILNYTNVESKVNFANEGATPRILNPVGLSEQSANFTLY